MDFAWRSCPYCGRAVDSSEPGRYVCGSCGKIIHSRLDDVLAFFHPRENGDRFEEAFAALADGNQKKAMDIADELAGSSECCDHDSLFLRGYVYAQIGEDGKSLAEWKKALELLSNDVELDAYLCFMAKGITDMILYKEREFIEFNSIAHIDRLAEDIDSSTGMSCKSLLYYTIMCYCIKSATGEEEVEQLKDVVPGLFRRAVAYQRNYWTLPVIIEQYLEYIGYNEETFEDDDNEVPHIYYLVRKEFEEHLAKMTEEDRIRIFDRWDDKTLRETIEPLLDAMVGPKRGGLLGKLRRKEVPGLDLATLIHAYVDKCLLIDGPPEEPAEPQEQS